MEDTNATLVIDNGSGFIKCGFAGDEVSGANSIMTFPNFVGRTKHYKVMAGGFSQNILVGMKAKKHRGVLKLNYPVSHGTITDWDDMERVWDYTYRLLKVEDPHEHPVLITEAPLNPPRNRGRVAEIFFEKFNCPAFYTQITALLSLYATGRTTGVVLDSGDGVTSAVPVFEGFALTHAIERSNIAGRDVTEYLQLLLRKAGNNFVSSAELEVVRLIKEKICYVVYNIEKTEYDTKEDIEPDVPYTLPDGTPIEVGTEQYRAPEVLFNPSIIGSEEIGIHQVLVNALLKSDKMLRRKLSPNIRLVGGSTMFGGLGDRLVAEAKKLLYPDQKIKMTALRRTRTTASCTGGTILANLSMFKKMWISRKEWNEGGMQVVYKKTY